MLNRDVLARLVVGARISLAIAALATLLTATVGAAVGLIAGYIGGAVDAVLMRLVDAAMAIPRLFVLLLLVLVWDRIPPAALIARDRAHRLVRDQPPGAKRDAAPQAGVRSSPPPRRWAHRPGA